MSSSIGPSGSVDPGVVAGDADFEDDGFQRLKKPPRLTPDCGGVGGVAATPDVRETSRSEV